MSAQSPEEFADLTLTKIQSVLDPEKKHSLVSDHDLLFAACSRVAKASGITLKKIILKKEMTQNISTYLNALTEKSHFRFRQVNLKENWWHFDNGPLLGFLKENNSPVALIPARRDGYWLYNPKDKSKVKVSSDIASTLSIESFYFYPIFSDKSLRVRDVFRFALFGRKKEFRLTIILQLVITLAGLLPSIMIGVLYDQVIPNRDINLMMQVVIALICNAFIMSAFSVSQFISIFRIKLKMNARVQPAIWDRILRVSTQFFKQFTIGDLANRLNSIDYSQQQVSTNGSMIIVNGLLAFVTIAVIFYFNVTLAFLTLLLALIIVIVSFVLVRRQLFYQRKVAYWLGRQLELVFQILNSISKIRVANVAMQMFKLWLDQFVLRVRLSYRSELYSVYQSVFDASFGIIATLTFFAAVFHLGKKVSFGQFIIMNGVFAQLFLSLYGSVVAISGLIRLIPFVERVKPVLMERPEDAMMIKRKMLLTGDIVIEDVSFRYHMDSDWVIEHLSLRIRPQQWTSLIGSSGAGKSTVYRLLLGFETPDSGEILFDGVANAQLDLNTLRSQIGAVLQTSVLTPASILENIIGISQALTEQDAWEFARMACIADDINAMPMKMQTLMTEQAKTFSVGQRQRLLIARALAKQPKILLLDEAMAALDDKTLDQVTTELKKLNLTIISSTHRLDMLARTDYIYVLEAGKISKEGTYSALANSLLNEW